MNARIFAGILTCCLSGISLSFSAATGSQTLAFPGALGFGAQVTGGRSGTVYHVTNLNDAGTGSFRDAVGSPNRIVVFDVGGYVSLNSAVSVKSNITIAGQTAPGEGIGFRGSKISCGKSSNIIIRYIRIRPGSETASNEDVALNLYDGRDMIIDHCSFEFAPWNNIGGVSDDWQTCPVTNITFQSCLVADPIYQQFGAHCESVSSDWSWFYTIFANSHNRNPLEKVNDVFVNNVLYNCSAGYTTHTSTRFKHDIINNHFIFGPASTGTDNTWYQIDKNQSIYCSGNIKDKNLDGVLNGDTTTPYWYQGEGTVLTSPWSAISRSVKIYSSKTAFRLAVSFSGVLPRDQMDSLIINQVKTLGKGATGLTAGTTGPGGSLYSSQTQTGLGTNGYGTIRGGTREADTDNDGMPDYWEKALGTNVSSNDAMQIGASGYANIERYINWLGDLHGRTSSATAVDIDLLQYAGGFSGVNPALSVSNAVGGAVSLGSDGHTARFTPASGFSGLAGFAFTVSGTDNTSYSDTVSVLVVPSGTGVALDARVQPGQWKPVMMFNPANASITLINASGYEIADVAGRIVKKGPMLDPSSLRRIDVSRLPDGVYLCRFFSGERRFYETFVVSP
ncbi:MAG: hypothetical protein JW768_11580 [Chitinispirillaceae bacterium]|nr:hypothetical protein [Chitinispirillaceae bacterium]